MPKSAKGDARREQLLVAAAKVIGERGFAETRLADVAKEVGISPSLAVYYFSTREALLIESLRYSEDLFYVAVSDHLTGLASARERLVALVRVTCSPERTIGLPAGWALWFDLWAQALRHPDAARDRAELDERWRVVVADVVREGQEAGEFGDVDADRFAQMFTALLDGLAVQVALADENVTTEQALSLSSELCDVMLAR